MIAIATIFLMVCLAALFWKRQHLAGTTLTAAWWWLIVAVTGVGAAFALIAWYEQPWWAPAVRFAAACLSFCPSMAVLGAKRPQHTAWTFITASLWIVLVLPSAEQLLFQPGQPLEIHDARSFFLLVLMGLCLVNHLPTRFWLPALLLTAAQTAALQPYLPWLSAWGDVWATPAVALICGGLAMVLTALWLPAFHRYPASSDTPEEQPADEANSVTLNQIWRDFRDCFGALWSVRVIQRMDAVARQQEWDVTLIWTGFVTREALQETEPDNPYVKRALFNLLRRFLHPASLR